MSAHKYYTPTESEQQMIVAGMVTIESLDEDYQEYVTKAPYVADGEVCAYEQWQRMKRSWDELNQEYEATIDPYYTGSKHDQELPYELKQRQNYLLREMSFYEVALGY